MAFSGNNLFVRGHTLRPISSQAVGYKQKCSSLNVFQVLKSAPMNILTVIFSIFGNGKFVNNIMSKKRRFFLGKSPIPTFNEDSVNISQKVGQKRAF